MCQTCEVCQRVEKARQVQRSSEASAYYREAFKKCGVLHSKASAYHPQTNGLVERFNRTLKRISHLQINTHRTGINAFPAFLLIEQFPTNQQASSLWNNCMAQVKTSGPNEHWVCMDVSETGSANTGRCPKRETPCWVSELKLLPREKSVEQFKMNVSMYRIYKEFSTYRI